MSYNDIFTGMLVVFVIYQHLMLNHKKVHIIETDIQDALDKHFKDIS